MPWFDGVISENHDFAETGLDGWARFVRSGPEELQLAVSSVPPGGIGGAPEPSGPMVHVPATGRVTATRVVVPRVFVWGLRESPPPPFLHADELLEWDGWPLRFTAEVPPLRTKPVAVKVRRDGREIEITVPTMTREFLLVQVLQQAPAR